MASNNPMSTPDLHDPSSSSTVFVQADPSNFRLIVQKLTGAPPPRPSSTTTTSSAAATCLKRPPSFKLHERRRQSTMKKLELNVCHLNNRGKKFGDSSPLPSCFSAMASPVSTLDQAIFYTGSPGVTEEGGEENGVAGKGLYLQTSPLCTPREKKTPQLLHLFPLQSSHAPDS